MDIEQLELQRAALVEQGKAIHAAAEAAGRGLTAEEEHRHKRIVADISAIGGSIAAIRNMQQMQAVRPPVTVTTATAVATGQRIAPAASPRGSSANTMQERLGSFAFADLYQGNYQASVTGTSVASGSILLPHEVMVGVVASLDQASVMGALGLTILALDGNGSVTLPYVDEKARGQFVGAGDEVTAANLGFKGAKLVPHKVVVLLPCANEALRSASPSVTALLMGQVSRALATTLDDSIFEGAGTEHEPRGIKNRTDILNISLGPNGLVPTSIDPFIDAKAQLESQNATPSAWVMSPLVWSVLQKLRENSTDSNIPLLGTGSDAAATGVTRKMLGLPVVLHSGLSVTEVEGESGPVCGSVYLAQWDQVIVGRWSDMLLDVDGSRLFNRDMSEIRGILQFDVAVPNAAAVCRISGVRGHLEP